MIRQRKDRDGLQVQVYAGRDPLTGRKRYVSRQVPGSGRAAMKQAKQIETQLMAEVGAGRHQRSAMTLAQLLDEWLAWRESNGKPISPATLHGYRLTVETKIKPALGFLPVAKVDARVLDRSVPPCARAAMPGAVAGCSARAGSAASTRSCRARWRERARQAYAALVAAGRPVTGARLAEAADISASYGRALLAEFQTDPTLAAAPGNGQRPKVEVGSGDHDIWRTCPSCGSSFEQPDDPGRKRVYCSRACQQAAYRARQRPSTGRRTEPGSSAPVVRTSAISTPAAKTAVPSATSSATSAPAPNGPAPTSATTSAKTSTAVIAASADHRQEAPTATGPAPPAATTWPASGPSSPPCCARPPPPASHEIAAYRQKAEEDTARRKRKPYSHPKSHSGEVLNRQRDTFATHGLFRQADHPIPRADLGYLEYVGPCLSLSLRWVGMVYMP
jgi:hypothetical protein